MRDLRRDYFNGKATPVREELIDPKLFAKGADFGAYGVLALKGVEGPWSWAILANLQIHFYLGGSIKAAAEWLGEYSPAHILTKFERRCVLSYCARWAKVRLARHRLEESVADAPKSRIGISSLNYLPGRDPLNTAYGQHAIRDLDQFRNRVMGSWQPNAPNSLSAMWIDDPDVPENITLLGDVKLGNWRMTLLPSKEETDGDK